MKRKPLAYILALVFLLFGLAGCAEKWEKPGGTTQEFDAMKASCISRSAMRFPPLPRQIQLTAGYTDPIQTNCNSFGYSTNCTTTGGQYHPPVMLTVDDNDSARSQDTRSCFFENGWTPVKDRPTQEVSGFTPIPNESLENCCSDHGGLLLNKFGTRRCSDDFSYLRCNDNTSSSCPCQ